MITLTKVNLWDGFVGNCSPKLQDYLKTDCIFTDWLASRGEIKSDGTTDALIVVCQLAGFVKKTKEKATLRCYREYLGKARKPGKLPTQEVNGKRYALLCSSAGLLKEASFYYVREDLYKDAMSFIWGALAPWKIKAVKNKWLVYPGLLFSTATKVEWTVDFDRIAVLPDIFNAVEAEIKRLILPEINKEGAWPQLRDEVITKEMNLSDGLAIRFVDEDIPYRCGTKEELASYVAKTPLKAYTIRQHFVKGLCVELPRTFLNAVLRYCTKDGKRLGLSPETVVTDIFGNPHSLTELDMVMFESVFKMGSAYRDQFGKDGFAVWAEHVKKETPSFYVCVEQHRKKENRLTAQPYQTMVEPSREQFQKLFEARNILEDYESLTGIAPHLGASLGKAVRLFPKLAATPYCKSEAAASRHNALWGLLKGQIPLGKESGYLFVATDPVAIIQGMVGADITGCLKANEVCAPHEREGRMLVIRHPHPNQNLVVVDNRHVLSPTMGSDVIWASSHDLMSIVLKMDFDGDHLQVITNETLIELTEETNRKYGTRPVVWDSPKGAKELCSPATIGSFAVEQVQKSHVGQYSDALTRMWNSLSEKQRHDPRIVALFALGEYLINEDIDASKGGGDISKLGDWFMARPQVAFAEESEARAFKKSPDNPAAWLSKQKAKGGHGIQDEEGNLNAWNQFVLSKAKLDNQYEPKTDKLSFGEPAYWQFPEDYPMAYDPATDGQMMFDHDVPVRRVPGLLSGGKNCWEKDKDGNIRLSETGFPIPICQWGKWASMSASDFKKSEDSTDKNVSLMLKAQEVRLAQMKLDICEWICQVTGEAYSEYQCANLVAMHLYYFRGLEKYPMHWFRFFWQVFGDIELTVVRKNWALVKAGTFTSSKDGKALDCEIDADVDVDALTSEDFDDVPDEYQDILDEQEEEGRFAFD